MHHAGDGRSAAGLHVGGGARDGAGGGDAAEQHRGDVADALGHQLHVGAVVPADHESATTQDSSDSMAARMAMVTPLANWSRNSSKLKWGIWKRGQALSMM